jgi:TRAP-type C4-dicarboxylate transport system permease small subunit
MNVANRVLQYLTTFEKWLAATAYVAVASLLIGDIIFRELLSSSLLGAHQIAVLCAVTAAFAGFALVTHEGGHLRLSGLDQLVPVKYRSLQSRLGDALSAAVFGALTVAAYEYVGGSFRYGDTVPVLYLPLWPFQVILIYAMGASAIRHAVFFILPETKPSLNDLAAD